MQNTLRKAILPMVAALAIGTATPVLSADYIVRPPPPRAAMVPAPVQAPLGPLTLQDALAIAADIGVVTVQNTHLDGDEWEIEGRDGYGKWIQVDVDARTGEVRHVDRSII
ncbi:MAG: hypothetical protein JWR49_26 [Tardiphaga sp.]|jgi:hypothetical protein|nr:hypothetical protein [Tardiphaga sp.]